MKLPGIFLLVLVLAGCVSQHGVEAKRAEASAKAHTELASLYYERGQIGVALDELRLALLARPDYAPAYAERGLVHMALREDKEAEEDFQHSLNLDSNDSNAHNNYGWFLCQQHGRELESVKQFLAALKNPLYATPEKAYLNAGVCSRKAGEMKDAEAYLQKALLFQPDMPEALLELAELDFANGDYVSSNSNFKRFAQVAGANLTAGNLWLGVRIERTLGDRNAEDSYALQLRKRFPESRETQLMLQGR